MGEIDRWPRSALIARADANAKVISDWVARTAWVEFLAADPAIRSNTSVCLKVVDPAVTALSRRCPGGLRQGAGQRRSRREGVGYDIGHYRDAPPGLRIWCGATVEEADLEALTGWLDWAFAATKDALPKAA